MALFNFKRDIETGISQKKTKTSDRYTDIHTHVFKMKMINRIYDVIANKLTIDKTKNQ